jgi:hypothetical protein
MYLISLAGTGTLIKSGRVKLVLWTQTFPFSEIMWSCKCFLDVKMNINVAGKILKCHAKLNCLDVKE